MVVAEKHTWLFFTYSLHQKNPQLVFGILTFYQLINMKILPLPVTLLYQTVFHIEIARHLMSLIYLAIF